MLYHQAHVIQHARADVARPAELPRLPKTSVNAKTKQRNKPNQNVIANLNSEAQKFTKLSGQG